VTGTPQDLGPVRPLTVADLPACLDLAASRDWPREEVKWRLGLDAGSALGVDDLAGGLAGSVTVTRYEPGLAVIGLLVVSARHGRRGLGRLLMEHALRAAAGRVTYLFATPEGRPLYESMGFRVLDHVSRHVGTYQPGAAAAGPGRMLVRPAVPADRAGVLALDRAAFGADRAAVLGRMAELADQVVMVAADGGGIAGHGSAWLSLDTSFIGPVVARDDATARRLIETLATGASGPVRIDLPARFAGLAAWLAGRGLLPVAADPLMSYQGRPVPGTRDRLYALFLQAYG
jgi:predicted N-acetyltransferase YhbS